jgi:hypothetical protein
VTLDSAQNTAQYTAHVHRGPAAGPGTLSPDRLAGPTALVPVPSLPPSPDHAAVPPLPAMISDPLHPAVLLDLAAAPATNFNLVDGTVSLATDAQMPFVLYKGTNRDTWFYAPRWGRIARNPDGEPAFLVTKKVRNNPDGSKTTVGGILSFMVELVVELPTDAERERWTQLIRTLYNISPGSGAFSFQPLRLSPGKMDISGLDTYAKPGQQLRGIDVGASSSIGLAIELTPDGADHFAALLGASPAPFPPQVAIMFTFRYQYLVPQCAIQATGFKKKAYDYFSWNAKARASYFGLVDGTVDYSSVRADLRQQEALDVHVVGTPPAGVDLGRMLDSIFDTFVRTEVGQWIAPDPRPAQASAPGGFFGGVSVAMKDVVLSDSARFDRRIDYSGISEGIHQVSFNFEQQLGAFSAAKHLFIEEDDIKLPFQVSISNSTLVKRVAAAASYTTTTGPRMVQCGAVDGRDGGLREGIIQYTWPNRPTSAQVALTVDFAAPHVGYVFHRTQPVSDTGAVFEFHPDQFVQRTRLFFVMAALVTDATSKALFKWEWTPPPGDGPARPPVSGYFLLAPDPAGLVGNLPTHDIEFPYHPDDYIGEGTPRVRFALQGLTGEWRNRVLTGSIALGENALAVDWDGLVTVGLDTLAVPAAVAGAGLGPAYRARLAAQAALHGGS